MDEEQSSTQKTSKERMEEVLTAYFHAWENQDSDELAELFAENGVYRVKPFGQEEYEGRAAIRGYWDANPVSRQQERHPRVLNAAYGNNLCFAEWENTWVHSNGARILTQGILELWFEVGLIKELREHYASTELSPAPAKV